MEKLAKTIKLLHLPWQNEKLEPIRMNNFDVNFGSYIIQAWFCAMFILAFGFVFFCGYHIKKLKDSQDVNKNQDEIITKENRGSEKKC